MLVLAGTYAASSSYSGSSNGILAKLNEYVDATAPDPVQTTIIVNNSSSASIPIGSTASVVVTVKLSSGNPVSGATVSLSASQGGIASVSPSTTTSDATGKATFTIQGTSTGTVTYTGVASANGTTTQRSNTVSVAVTGVKDASRSLATIPDGTIGVPTPILITVKDTNGAVVSGAASSLSISIGGTNGGAAVGAITDNGNGTYSASYTPAAAGTDSVTIKLDSTAISGSPYSTVVTAALAIATPSLPAPILTQSYNQTVATTGGTAPVSFVISAGTLPAGLTLNAATGAITGTPTTAGAYSFTVTATDTKARTATQTYSGTIAAGVVITTTSLPTPVLGQAYSQTVATTGGTAPTSFAVSVGTLPTGLTLNTSTGVISGTATAAGAYTFTIMATDANGLTSTQAYSGTIAAGVAITTTSLPTPVLGQAYSQTVTTTGGTAPISFSISAGSLPTGLSLNTSNGVISGTATAAGAYTFTIIATDANGLTSSQAYSGTIAAGVAITTTSLPTPILGQSYSQTVVTTGGTAPISFAISAGSLPTGLTLNTSTGVISGTATAAGAYTFTVQATDANNLTSAQVYNGTIAAGVAIITTSLPTPVLGQSYSQTVATTGGTAPISFAISAGNLPIGLSLDTTTGVLSGTVSTAGTFSFTVQVTDGNGVVTSQSYGFTIAPSAAPASVTVAYASANNEINLLTLAAGMQLQLSTGPEHGQVTLSAGKAIYTPANDYIGTDSFTYVVADSNGQSNPALVSITVSPPPPPTAEAPPSQTIEGNDDTTTTTSTATFNLQELVKGLYSDVQIVTQPKHGTVTLISTPSAPIAFAPGGILSFAASMTGVVPLTAVYTADPGYVGPDSFAYIAVGPGGASAPATVNIEVIKPIPTAKALVAQALGGQTVRVDLTAAADSGPFTGAALVSTPTPSLGTTRLIEGGTATARTYVLEFTPKGAYTGEVQITYTLTNESGTSQPLSVTITLQPRPDAASDTDVTGVADAQSQAARVFAGSQIDNFNRRLEALRTGSAGSSNGLTVTSGAGQMDECAREARNVTESEKCREAHDAVAQKMARSARANGNNEETQPPTSPTTGPNRVSVWTGGAIVVGKRDASTGRARLSFESTGVSAGADVGVGNGAHIGVGAGFGSQETDIARNGSNVKASNWVVVAYGSQRFANRAFVDGVIGLGGLDFDLRRYVTDSASFAYANRKGDLTFAALTAGMDGQVKQLGWSIYGRAEAMQTDLEAYTENGPALYSLTYDGRSIRSMQGVLGARVQNEFKWRGLLIQPRGRLEFRHEFQGVDSQSLRYADWLDGTRYTIAGDGWTEDHIRFELGSRIRFTNAWNLDFEVGTETGTTYRSHTARVTADRRF